MDLAFRAIQPPMQTSPPVRMRRNGGKSGRRLAVSNSAPQSTSATSNTKLVMLIVADVVAPYAHGAYTRAAKKIHRDALRKMIEITWEISKAKISSIRSLPDHQSCSAQRPLPKSIVYNVFNTIMASSFSE